MDPYWMYKVKKGQVASKLFDTKKEPKGWYDSPKAAKAAKEESEIDLATAEALDDDNSTGSHNQLG